MKIHILGICGSFMGGVSMLAKALGHEVSGSDKQIYPPMSDQLQMQGIEVMEGYYAAHLEPIPDLVIVGNTMSRGNPLVEIILNNNIPYTSAPEWLSKNVLQNKRVLAVSGTHGKTTITAMLCWIFEQAGLHPGFLIGGVSQNFNVSARLGNSEYFIIEADEYDTAFFDKRSKFVHYRPDTLIINNIEYDHADIFADLNAIIREFHNLVRIVPSNGMVICKQNDVNIKQLLEMGCWSSVEYFNDALPTEGTRWGLSNLADDCSQFNVVDGSEIVSQTLEWQLFGQFNAENALAAIAAAFHHAGIKLSQACDALMRFKNVKRRLEQLAYINQITIYDDFAHHPTAINATLKALRAKVKNERIILIIEPHSNTMRNGYYKDVLANAFIDADFVYLYVAEDYNWSVEKSANLSHVKIHTLQSIDVIVSVVSDLAVPNDHILIMTSGNFSGLHQKLLQRFSA